MLSGISGCKKAGPKDGDRNSSNKEGIDRIFSIEELMFSPSQESSKTIKKCRCCLKGDSVKIWSDHTRLTLNIIAHCAVVVLDQARAMTARYIHTGIKVVGYEMTRTGLILFSAGIQQHGIQT